MTRKKPKEGFSSGGWVKSFKLLPIGSGDGFDLAEEVVEELKEELGDDYSAFERRLEGIAGRYLTQNELCNKEPDSGEIRAMLNKWERRLEHLYQLAPDSISEDLVADALGRGKIDYYELKERLHKDLSLLVTGITIAARELGASPTGRRPKPENEAVARDIEALLTEYGLKAKVYAAGLWCRLLRIIYDAAGENDADPLQYTRTVKTLPK